MTSNPQAHTQQEFIRPFFPCVSEFSYVSSSLPFCGCKINNKFRPKQRTYTFPERPLPAVFAETKGSAFCFRDDVFCNKVFLPTTTLRNIRRTQNIRRPQIAPILDIALTHYTRFRKIDLHCLQSYPHFYPMKACSRSLHDESPPQSIHNPYASSTPSSRLVRACHLHHLGADVDMVSTWCRLH